MVFDGSPLVKKRKLDLQLDFIAKLSISKRLDLLCQLERLDEVNQEPLIGSFVDPARSDNIRTKLFVLYLRTSNITPD